MLRLVPFALNKFVCDLQTDLVVANQSVVTNITSLQAL